MSHIFDDNNSDNDFFNRLDSKRTTKEDLLDENFKRASKYQKNTSSKKTNRKKRPFLKSGILLLITAIICAFFVSQLPWAYVKCEVNTQDGEIEENVYAYEDEDDLSEKDVIQIFQHNGTDSAKNASQYSYNLIGLNVDDLDYTPKITTYGFIVLAIVAIFLIIFQIVDRMKNFTDDIFLSVHSFIICVIVAVCIYIFIYLTKFLSANILINYNYMILIPNKVLFIPVAPIIYFVILIAITKISFSLLRSNFQEMHRRKNFGESLNTLAFFSSKGGGKT